jgi:hypothetical protein
MRMDIDSIVALARPFTGQGAANARSVKFSWSATLPTVEMGNSGGTFRQRLASGNVPSLDTDHLWVWLIDLTKTGAERVTWLVDTAVVPADVLIAGTATSIAVDDFLGQPFRLLADVNAVSIMDAKPSMFFMDWGQSPTIGGAYALPDVSTPEACLALFNRFQAAAIGDDGSGPLGHQPKHCYYGEAGAADGSDADTWNATAGLLNRGTEGGALIKQAGTYV